MPLTLSLNDVKSIVKTIVKHETITNLKIGSGSIFVQRAHNMKQEINRYHFLVTTGGHGKAQWIAGTALNWLSNVATGAAGLGTSGMGAFASAGTTAAGKAASLNSLGGARRAGVIRDTQFLHNASGVRNMLPLLESQDALVGCGFVDASGASKLGVFVTPVSDLGTYNVYKNVLDNPNKTFKYRCEGSYLRAQGRLTIGQKFVTLEKP